MYEDRIRNEAAQLLRLKALLDGDSLLPLRFDAERRSLDARDWRVHIRGIRSMISASRTADNFVVQVRLPQGYPWQQFPDVTFGSPIPFHPHVYPSGKVCWGSGNAPRPELTLVDWFRGLIEYLQHNQDSSSLYVVDPWSAANRPALEWWEDHRARLGQYVPPINMSRLRFWVDQCHG